MRLQHILRALPLAGALLLTGCMDDTVPTSGATAEQVAQADKGGLSRSVMACMNRCTSYSSGGGADDIGYAGFMIWRESMTADFAAVSDIYNYYPYFYNQTWLGDYAIQTRIWERHYSLIHSANLLIQAADPERQADRPYLGNALAYRALAYMDLARMYEFKPTGVPGLDAEAESRGIMGLTVPIVDQNTTEAMGKHNARAPFWRMYRFILSDLAEAERCLASAPQGAKNEASLGVVYGLQARLWLEMATRFRLHPQDLDTQLAHEDDADLQAYARLEATSAAACYARAAERAEMAINQGYSPLAQSQWYDTANGFNTPNNSWMWAIIISPNDDAAYLSWQSWVSYVCPEASWAVASTQYMAARMIDASLFADIPQGDWRRDTWTDPAEAGDRQAYESKYRHVTSLDFDSWAALGAYAGFKFHPAGGDTQTSVNGNAVSIPLMRVEEMWFILAEAQACSQGVGAGAATLESFVNSYRWRGPQPYRCSAASLDDFLTELLAQKRVEFWGESVTPWDFKRLEKAIVRAYEGTNHSEQGRANSFDHHAAPWMNLYIPDAEHNYNTDCLLNPDPSGAIPTGN